MVNRRSLIKRLIYVMTGLIALLTTYIVIGSIDSEEPKYHDFVGELAPANPELNGYTYLDARGFVDGELMDDEQGRWLKRDLKYGGWEADTTEKFVNQYREEIEAFKVAAAMPSLQYVQTDDPTELLSYVGLLNGIRLILLEAKLSAADGRMDESAENLKLAWLFSEKVKRMNGLLISYMIGIASQDEVLKVLQWVVSQFDFSDEHLKQFISALEGVSAFDEDEFRPVMQAELRYFAGYFDNSIDQPLAKRWDLQFEQASWAVSEESWYAGSKLQLWAALQAFFPKFYNHRNKNLNVMSIELEAVVGWSGLYCNELEGMADKEYQWFPEGTWAEILLPNQALLSLDNHRGQFKEYLIRRCMAYTQIEAVKAIIAMKLYAKKYGGSYPDSLESLVPEVLSRHPIDYMDGQNLRYSPAKSWFYSLGTNLQDDSGSASACYFNRCFWGIGCKDNPTFPLDLSVCEFSEVND